MKEKEKVEAEENLEDHEFFADCARRVMTMAGNDGDEQKVDEQEDRRARILRDRS